MNLFNEPHRLNRFIELDRISLSKPSIESPEMRLQRVTSQIDAAIKGIPSMYEVMRLEAAQMTCVNRLKRDQGVV